MININDKLYFLFTKLGVYMLRSRHQIHESEALPDGQLRILELLKRAHPRALNHTDLAKSLLVSKPNISGMIDRLENAGLIRRAPAESDRRMAMISLTAKGQKAYKAAYPSFQNYKKDCFMALTKQEKTRLRQLLEKMADHLEGRRRSDS